MTRYPTRRETIPQTPHFLVNRQLTLVGDAFVIVRLTSPPLPADGVYDDMSFTKPGLTVHLWLCCLIWFRLSLTVSQKTLRELGEKQAR
ncbi:hypothetical protein [Brasilonema sp. UFV-L1]|uniref:hypothetical protein n=1 Tax=Brasilonema sp. UFV-L1 TaxID=2234130 RepID=UPI00145E4C25|nr:hypothetical protein [Brasilonema sp. UFV-L1]